jgi:hypothetical protein
MGQIGNAVGGALGGMGGQPQNPMGSMGGGFGGNMGQHSFGDLRSMQNQPNMGGGFGGNMGGQLTPLPSPNMPGIDSYGGQPQVGGPAQMVGTDDAFFQSPEFKEYQNDPRNMMATQDMYNSPYFGQMGSGSVGRAQDAAYRKYKGLADPNQLYGQIPQNPMPQPGGSGNNNQLGQLGNRFGQLGNMANIPQPEIGMPGGQGGQTQGGMPGFAQPYGQQMGQMAQQAAQQQAMQQAAQQQAMQQGQVGLGQAPQAGLESLAALLGGKPTPPMTTVPTARPTPMAKPSVSRPAPVAPKPVAPPMAKAAAKPSVVPPKTPPAVARAIQKLAAKKQNRR